MAILVYPRIPTALFLQNRHGSVQLTSVRCSSSATVKLSNSKATKSTNGAKSTGAAVLWYKNDLRVDDHPGLLAASKHTAVVPLYVFDHRVLRYFNEEMLELLLFAVKDLRKSLKDLGSDLMIRSGRTESVIQDLVKEVRAANIYTQEEVEYDLQLVIEKVKENLEDIKSPKLSLWSTPFYDIKNMMDIPLSYDEFQQLKLSMNSPLSTPKLPHMATDLTWGPIPTLNDLKEFINESPYKSKDSWTSIKNNSAESVMQNARILASNSLTSQTNTNSLIKTKKRLKKSAFITKQGNVIGGGTNDILNALSAYLKYLEGTTRDDWQELHEKLREAETREGASFGALFGPSLHLGIVSRRRVYYETIKYEKERNGGFLSPFGFSSPTITATANHVLSMEWYSLLASRSQLDSTKRYSIRYWKWNGYLIQYVVVGSEGPAILLVHGFGAFLEHYRDNINNIAENGNRVWAITLLGFGRSEKPNLIYTELLWAEFIRDFIVDVVGEPVHLIGNSFGGYFVSIVAGLWPVLVRSVVLLNSAGHYIPEYSSVPPFKERKSTGIAWLGARGIAFYLKLSVRNLVKSCYPTKRDRADEGLLNEMVRASYDPGAVVVLESLFTFDPSIPMNYLLKGFEEKVVIIQGMKDPISESKTKVDLVKRHFKQILIKELDAGHCPHDELPEEVNSIIKEWVVNVENRCEILKQATKDSRMLSKKSLQKEFSGQTS
ncbi:hypothetical protein L2E82_07139 [Cichorium intybus]|uniref:Uncharacterized protein n=1 Tax=Cichorium intybus TaxID=13427 RepID=A0ACB9G3L0_CICIN|nr:hypothetical protein L2E82_07139 [Cichorium intybus]